MTNKQGTRPIFRLDEEGTLFECCEGFYAKVVNENRRRPDVASIEKGDFLLYLGSRHFRSKIGEMTDKARLGKQPHKPEVLRRRLLSELFHPPYYTSLNFLWKEKIVKVDWHGRWGLYQLAEASNFLYLHFRMPATERKVGK